MGGSSAPSGPSDRELRAQERRWRQELEFQANMQREQQATQERILREQREREAAEQARQEQLRKDELRKQEEAELRKKQEAQAQAAAQQASGAAAGSASGMTNAKLAAASQTAPGLSPYKAALDTASKAGNAFYSAGETKLGGN